jgi:regulator of sigma E protease
VVGGVKPMPALADSLRPGDRITALNGTETPDLAAFIAAAEALPAAGSASYTLDRDGTALTVEGPYPFPPVVDGVQPKSAAMAAGMRVGDVVTAVDGTPIYSFEQLRTAIGGSDGKTVTLSVWRDGTTQDIALTPRRADLPLPDGGFETRWLIGLTGGLVFAPETRTPGPWEAVKLGVSQTWALVSTTLSGLWHMVTGAISTCNLQGPIGIAETSADAASQGGASFVWFIAMLSTAVGLMNLFPIPVLDGGHLVFHAWEAVTGHPPTERALRGLMAMGLSILLTLMLFALGNDLLFCR